MTSLRLPVAAVLAVLFVTRIPACECGEGQPQHALKYAAIVFQGKVTEIDHLNPIDPPDSKPGDVRQVSIPRQINDHTVVTFRVTRAWRGPVTREIKVYATARPSMCDGYKFRDGVEYVVYASTNLYIESEERKRYSQGATVYEISDCPLRIRTDVTAEAKRLGLGRSIK
jgi:hypothetical protein